MDLQQRVARLKQTIETIRVSLQREQSDLASVRQQLDALQRDDLKVDDPASASERHRLLDEVTRALADGLRVLEDDTTQIERIADELRDCARRLQTVAGGGGTEGGGAAPVEGQDELLALLRGRLEHLESDLRLLRDVSGQRDTGSDQVLARLRERLEAVEAQLRQLSDGQASLELQTALLSREAAEAIEPSAPAQGAGGPASQPTELTRRIGELERRLAGLEQGDGPVAPAPLVPDTGIVPRLDAIEDLQKAEQVHVDELERVLEGRLDALSDRADQLQQETGRLADGIEDSGRRVRHQEERLNDHQSHLGALEERRRGLQEKVDGLGTGQARQDNAGRDLQRRLARRSWLALALFTVLGGLLGYLLLRGPTPADVAQLTQRLDAVSGTAAASETRLLREEVGRIRLEVDELGTDLDQVRRTLDAMPPGPDLDRRLQRLDAAVEALRAADRRRSQQLDAWQQEQARLQAELAGLRQRATTRESRTVAPQDQTPPAPDVPSDSAPPAPRPPAPADTQPAAAAPTGQATAAAGRWAAARRTGRYTLQLLGVHSPESMAWYLERHRLPGDSAIHHGERGGRRWLALLHGIYGSIAEAQAAARRLPPGLAAGRPWVRRIPRTGDLEAR